MNYKIVVATVLGLLMNKAACDTTNHFNLVVCNQIADAKTLYLKDISKLIKEKLGMLNKEVMESLTDLNKKFLESLEKTDEGRKKIFYLVKDVEKTKGTDLKKEGSGEESTGLTEEEMDKNDMVIFDWIKDYHKTTMAYSELNYEFYVAYGKSVNLKFLENFIEDHTVHTDGFFTNIVTFAILIPVFLGIMQFA